jgi:hypothetical protein
VYTKGEGRYTPAIWGCLSPILMTTVTRQLEKIIALLQRVPSEMETLGYSLYDSNRTKNDPKNDPNITALGSSVMLPYLPTYQKNMTTYRPQKMKRARTDEMIKHEKDAVSPRVVVNFMQSETVDEIIERSTNFFSKYLLQK